jgi:hypothetical protein
MNMTDYPTLNLDTRVPLVVYEMSILPEHLSSPPVFSGVLVAQYLDFCVVSCMSFFCWPLYCLSFDLQFLTTPLVSSNTS